MSAFRLADDWPEQTRGLQRMTLEGERNTPPIPGVADFFEAYEMADSRTLSDSGGVTLGRGGVVAWK
jgi:hypothetical protein